MIRQMLCLAALSAVLITPSCKSSSGDTDPMILPKISFKNAAGYVTHDTTVGKNVSLLTGITASKSEPKDVLIRFIVSRGYDSDTVGAAVLTQNLTGTEGDNYSADFPLTTRNTAGIEVYTYTVVNRDGLVNQVRLRLTVQ